MSAGLERPASPERRDLLLRLCRLGCWALAVPATRVMGAGCPPGAMQVGVERFAENPIVRPGMDPRMGSNVQGPSLIRVPSWVPDPLGRYYLYFADHKGAYIRLAYADRLEGPWRTHEPGSLQLGESLFPTEPASVPAAGATPPGASAASTPASNAAALEGFAGGAVEGVPSALESATLPHIASPDAHVREDRREIVLYYHGLDGFRSQHSRVATSKDGIHFTARPELLGAPYFRVFSHRGWWYALGMPGVLYRSRDGLGGFEQGATLFPPTMRHSALLVRADRLHVFWTRVGDAPEHILLSTVDLDGEWSGWRVSEPIDVLFPERDWEGADRPLVASVRDAINVRVRQLRDPAVFEEAGRAYLLYSVAGESGIAIAELTIDCR
jgi:hypothetical protein